MICVFFSCADDGEEEVKVMQDSRVGDWLRVWNYLLHMHMDCMYRWTDDYL